MEAGRQLDAEVAVKVMGWMLVHKPIGDGPRTDAAISPTTQCMMSIPHYSTDIEAAWAVVEKLSMTTKQYWRTDYFSTGAHVEVSVGGQSYEAAEETMPHAICLAALKAMRPAGQEG